MSVVQLPTWPTHLFTGLTHLAKMEKFHLRIAYYPHHSDTISAAKREYLWFDEEKRLLMSLRRDGMSFKYISEHFKDRTLDACRKQYENLYTTIKSTISWPWTSSGEQLLFALRRAGYNVNEVSVEFPERTRNAVMKRSHSMGFPLDHKADHSWTQLEDQQLRNLHRAGVCWKSIAESIPKPSAGVCLVRYLELYGSLSYPCATISAFPWTPQEIECLVGMRENGKTWDEIALQLPGHVDGECRRYWYNNHWNTYRQCLKSGQIHDVPTKRSRVIRSTAFKASDRLHCNCHKTHSFSHEIETQASSS